ncbi:hypothetical protein NQ317_003065 [Molorchus minor]|uniref:Uncharacterized protein n=1 Tax=Molorchus minor TaxID=1323400 RepID=A0ABQ9IW88_9CUCU|nr:hypothetical protein NQ317_003065 [Molorchus minor]
MNTLTVAVFAMLAVACSAIPSGIWGLGAINPHALSPIGPSGIVTGAGASGPSGVVTGAGAVGPSGIVNGHGAVGPTGPNGHGIALAANPVLGLAASPILGLAASPILGLGAHGLGAHGLGLAHGIHGCYKLGVAGVKRSLSVFAMLAVACSAILWNLGAWEPLTPRFESHWTIRHCNRCWCLWAIWSRPEGAGAVGLSGIVNGHGAVVPLVPADMESRLAANPILGTCSFSSIGTWCSRTWCSWTWTRSEFQPPFMASMGGK